MTIHAYKRRYLIRDISTPTDIGGYPDARTARIVSASEDLPCPLPEGTLVYFFHGASLAVGSDLHTLDEDDIVAVLSE